MAVLVLLTRPCRNTDQKITWLPGWLHHSHVASALFAIHLSFQDYGAGPKNRHWILINSGLLGAAPSSLLLLALLVDPGTSLALEAPFWTRVYVPPPMFQLAGEWLKQPGHAQKRRGGGGVEALRPSRAYTRLHSSPPISHPAHTTRALLQQWRANCLMSHPIINIFTLWCQS